MHLVKWIRKNMNKLMAVFVIVIMIAFIMPSLLNQLSKPRTMSQKNAMWLYGTDKQITVENLRQATAELSVLRGLYTDRFLLAQQDIRSILLGQLLFPESEKGAVLCDEIKNLAMQSRLRISPSQIDNFFSQSRGRAELFFILLKEEASQAGCVVSPKSASEVLNMIIPQLTNNQADAATMVKNASASNGMSDEQVLSAFADILSIMSYSRITGDTENVTESQLENMYARAMEKMNIEFVQFSAGDFLDKVSQPGDTEIAEQFAKYKDVLPGRITDDNPCGFGYKLQPRVAIDYMIIKIDDLKKDVKAPAEEEVEEYYRQNLERSPITIEVPADANDPNSKYVKKQRSYAEVADMIRKGLYTRKINAQAAKILGQAIEQTDAGFESLDFETATVDTFKAKAGDYDTTAKNLSKQYNVKIYAGRTSLLSAEEIQSDRYLGSLAMTGQSRMPTRLAKLVFAVKQFGDEASKLGPFEPSTPRIYVSVGPLSDLRGEIVAIARVVEAAGSQAPADISFSYQKNLPKLDEPNAAEDDKYVLKNVVAEDCKKLAAMETAKKAAAEFADVAAKQSWDAALDKINAAYGKKNSGDPNERTFTVRTINNVSRVSQTEMDQAKMRVAGMIGAEEVANQTIIYGKLIDAFYSEYKDMQSKKENPPVIFDFQPRLACYVIKNISVDDVGTVEDYQKVRQQLAIQQDFIDSQNMAIEYFMPDNITKRMNLKPANESKKQTDANDANAVPQGESK